MPVKVTGLENLGPVPSQGRTRSSAAARSAPQPPGPMAEDRALQTQTSEAITARLLAVERLARETHELAAKLERRRSAVYVGDNLAFTRVLDRFIMYADTRDLGVTPHILLDGEWEPHLTKILSDFIKPKMTVVDIGANFGYFTLLAAASVGPEGLVYAFEPHPRNFEILQKNVAANWYGDWVHCFNCALMDTPQQLELHSAPSLLGSSSFFMKSLEGQSFDHSISVTARTLDELVPGPVDVMKMDAEGSEPFIFEGMKAVLERSPQLKMVMEFNVPALKAAGVEPKQFLERLRDLGLAPMFLSHAGNIEALDEEMLLKGPICNVVLSKG